MQKAHETPVVSKSRVSISAEFLEDDDHVVQESPRIFDNSADKSKIGKKIVISLHEVDQTHVNKPD